MTIAEPSVWATVHVVALALALVFELVAMFAVRRRSPQLPYSPNSWRAELGRFRRVRSLPATKSAQLHPYDALSRPHAALALASSRRPAAEVSSQRRPQSHLCFSRSF